MKRFLSRLIVAVAFMSMCLPVFSQVKLSDSGVTKFYDNGTRITYFEMADFPNSPEMREFVSKIVLENPDVKRVVIYRNGSMFMYEALQGVEPDMIVEAVNDALAEYKANIGDFPPSSPQDYEKQKANVKVTKHYDNGTVANGTVSSEKRVTEEKKVAGQKRPSSNLKAVPVTQQSSMQPAVNNSTSKDIETVSPAKYNGNSKNR